MSTAKTSSYDKRRGNSKKKEKKKGQERELVRRGKRMEKKSGPRHHGCTETDMNGL